MTKKGRPPGGPFAFCEALVRRADSDRYLAALLAPAPLRPPLFALYAFNYEVARTAESVSQPLMGQIRLQWWRDAVEEIYTGSARTHEVVQALAETIAVHGLPRALLDAAIDAREKDLDEAPFEDWASLLAYVDATSGHIMRLAARVLGAGDEGSNWGLDKALREAAIAYGLVGLSRALPFHAARRRLMLPVEALRAVALSQEQVFSGEMDAKVTALIGLVAQRAREHLEIARRTRIPRGLLPAALPAALVPIYLRVVSRRKFNPFRDVTDVPIHRRQLAMLGAAIWGKL